MAIEQKIQNEARTSYVGVGRRQIVEQTFWQVPWWNQIDPLAQTFLLTEERYITGVDLFFGTKGGPAVTVQIRDVVNGYPGTTVLASKVLESSMVQVSENGQAATRITFADPVLLQANVEYALVVLTGSSQYRLFVARMSAKDLVTGINVARQPYAVGVLFSSSNATAWTAHQEMDLKFRLYGAKFKKEGKLYFNPLQLSKPATQLILSTSQLVPKGCNLQWQWSPDGKDWFPLADMDVTSLGKEAENIYIRALLAGQEKTSPVLQPNSTGAVAMAYKSEGTYLSKLINANSPFGKITVYVDFDTPTGTSQTVEYSVDDGKTWAAFGSEVSRRSLDTFTQYKYEKTLAAQADSVRIRIKQTTAVKKDTPKARRLMVTLS